MYVCIGNCSGHSVSITVYYYYCLLIYCLLITSVDIISKHTCIQHIGEDVYVRYM